MISRINGFSQNRHNNSFGISRQALDNMLVKHQLKVVPTRNYTSGGQIIRAYLLKKSNKTAGITGMLAVEKGKKRPIILGEGKTLEEMMNNMAANIPEKSLIVRPFYHLAEIICRV